jgi:hypothetical protein
MLTFRPRVRLGMRILQYDSEETVLTCVHLDKKINN